MDGGAQTRLFINQSGEGPVRWLLDLLAPPSARAAARRMTAAKGDMDRLALEAAYLAELKDPQTPAKRRQCLRIALCRLRKGRPGRAP